MKKIIEKIKSEFSYYKFRSRMFYYDYIKTIFKPNNSRIRKAIPRQYRDICSLITDVNFEFVKAFYEEEYLDGNVDWENSSPGHKDFEIWLKEAYRFITVELPILESRLTEAYPPLRPLEEMFKPITDINGRKMYEMIDDGIPFQEKYEKVLELEDTIKEKTTKILVDIVNKRDYFWT